MKIVYKLSGGSFEAIGSVSDAYLWAWEYEPALEDGKPVAHVRADAIHLWRTRRPDLAPAELWLGETERPDRSRTADH